jgi:hypothetical protein
MSVTTHCENLNNWAGLFGRPTFRKSDGSSIDKNDNNFSPTMALKSIPSTNPTDLMSTSDINLCRQVWGTK